MRHLECLKHLLLPLGHKDDSVSIRKKIFMQSLVLKDYIPLLQTLVGGLLTFLGGLLGSVIIQQQQRKAERNSLASAFYGEIQALLKIIERRQYIQRIQEAIEDIRSNREISFRIKVTRKYFNVYEKNLDKIGILPGASHFCDEYLYSST